MRNEWTRKRSYQAYNGVSKSVSDADSLAIKGGIRPTLSFLPTNEWRRPADDAALTDTYLPDKQVQMGYTLLPTPTPLYFSFNVLSKTVELLSDRQRLRSKLIN